MISKKCIKSFSCVSKLIFCHSRRIPVRAKPFTTALEAQKSANACNSFFRRSVVMAAPMGGCKMAAKLSFQSPIWGSLCHPEYWTNQNDRFTKEPLNTSAANTSSSNITRFLPWWNNLRWDQAIHRRKHGRLRQNSLVVTMRPRLRNGTKPECFSTGLKLPFTHGGSNPIVNLGLVLYPETLNPEKSKNLVSEFTNLRKFDV